MLLLLIGRGVCASTRWQWKTLSRSLTHWCMTARRLRRRGRVVMRMHRVGHSQFAAIGVWLPGVHRLESLACHVPCARYQSLLWGHLHLSVCPMSRVGFVGPPASVCMSHVPCGVCNWRTKSCRNFNLSETFFMECVVDDTVDTLIQKMIRQDNWHKLASGIVREFHAVWRVVTLIIR